MSSWKAYEDAILTKTVLNFYFYGKGIDKALNEVASRLDKPFLECSERWYGHFKKLYSEELAKINQRQKKKIFGQNLDWTKEEDQKLLDGVIKNMIKGMPRKKAVFKVSKTIKRSSLECGIRWANHLLPKHGDYINKTIAEGKRMEQQKNQESDSGIKRNWGSGEEQLVVNIVLNSLKSGKMMNNAFSDVHNSTNRPVTMIKKYWYTYLYPENKQEIEKIKKSNNNWTKDMKYKLYETVHSYKNAGYSLSDAFQKVADLYQQKSSSVSALWYNSVRKMDDEFKSYFEKHGPVLDMKKPTNIVDPDKVKEPITGRVNWSEEEDKLLLDTCLKVLSSGGTFTQTFRQVSQLTGRTYYAVDARFRDVVRPKHKDAIREAKEKSRLKTPEQKAEEFAQQEIEFNSQSEEKNTPVDEVQETKQETRVEDLPTEQNIVEEKREENSLVQEDKLLQSAQEIIQKVKLLEKKVEDLEQENQALREKSDNNEYKEKYEKANKTLQELQSFFNNM